MSPQNLHVRKISVPILLHRGLHRFARIPPPLALTRIMSLGHKEENLHHAMTFLVRHGQPMYQGFHQPTGLHNRTCWLNSFLEHAYYREDSPEYAYAEGVAITLLDNGYYYTELHGWNLYKGHVYDVTLGRSPFTSYMGIVFPDEFLRFTTFMTGYGMNLLLHMDLHGTYLENYARSLHAP